MVFSDFLTKSCFYRPKPADKVEGNGLPTTTVTAYLQGQTYRPRQYADRSLSLPCNHPLKAPQQPLYPDGWRFCLTAL